MGGFLLIIPILAFDIWLSVTAGKRQIRIWIKDGQWLKIAASAVIGALLAVWLTFFLQYSNGPKLRVRGFPIPLVFLHKEDNGWTQTILPSALPYAGVATDLLTGLVAPFIPYKIAEFLKKVKAELK